ncbi:sodium:proton antiporter [Labedella populi]|uniref:Sodium:proton antiporter n=1 Tax=Labedella populi TaxID=2498850 RepID=A0A3S4A5Z2_9MICO|nr:DUF6328 family protein [Labedella populi]RWZ61115.1 sodium:proton antiporter [Labedella populi]
MKATRDASDAEATDARPDGRDESENERLDRHWSEILQELRVTQTGTQILTGFLLALAFQPTFQELDTLQTTVYLILVSLAALATVSGLAPVSSHRVLFGRLMKEKVVGFGDLLLRVTLAMISLLLTGVVFFLFDVVVSRRAATVAGAVVLLVVGSLWLVVPILVRGRTHSSERS